MALEADPQQTYDPLGDGTAIPVEVHEEMRAKCPIAHVGPDTYYVSRYEDVQFALKSVDNFVGGHRSPGVVVPEEEKLISEMAEPRHGRVRKVFNTAITGHRLDGIEEYVREMAAQLLDEALDKGPVDLMANFVRPIPAAVICELLGAPEEDREFWADWSDEMAKDEWVRFNKNERGEGFAGSFPEAAEKFSEMITTRRNLPDRSDFVAKLGQVEVEGNLLTDTEMMMILVFLFAAGNDTTRNLLGTVLVTLATDPALFEKVKADRSLIDPLVEESLRLHPPVPFLPRHVIEDIEIGGRRFCPGEDAFIGIASANRDASHFDEPHEMDLDRDDLRGHVSFGHGPHICPGASLARLETRVALDVFFDKVGSIEPAPGWVPSKEPVWWTDGPHDVQVVITSESGAGS